MANNYCQSSFLIEVPEEKLEQAKHIVERVEVALDTQDNGPYYSTAMWKAGVWIYSDESLDTEQVEALVRALVEELDLPGVHVGSWAYTCSKPRLDEFGGGAFAIAKGVATVWIDAATEAKRQMLEEVGDA